MNTTTATETRAMQTKPNAAMRRVLTSIAKGEPWRASHETVQAILDAGLASHDEDGAWSITAPSRDEAEDRFESAVAHNRRLARERHEANLVKMPRSSGFTVPT